MKNDGLKEVGKGFITLANLILVLFLFNNYMQKDDFNLLGVIFTLVSILLLYILGYKFVNKGDEE